MTTFTYKQLENEWLKKYGEFIQRNMSTILQSKDNYEIFNKISKNPNITWEIIENNPDYPWIWEISQSINITWEIIENNLDKSWDWECISENPNITWEIIENHPHKPWHWGYISSNTMELGKEQWINDLRLNTIRTLRLQRYWRYYSSHPAYKLAQRIITTRLEE